MIIRCLCTLVLFTTVFSIKTAAGSVDNLVTTMKFRGSQVVDFFVCNVGRRCNGLSRTPGADSHRSASLAGGTSALPKPFQQTPLRATTVAGHPRSDALRGLNLSGSRGGSGRTTRIVPDVGAFQWARIHDAVRLLAASGQPAHRSRRKRGRVGVDSTGLALGAVSTVFVRRMYRYWQKPLSRRHWLKRVVLADLDQEFPLSEIARHGPWNDCVQVPGLVNKYTQEYTIAMVLSDAEFDSERNHTHIRQQL